MKLNTLLFGLMMAPAAVLVGCSDYEDTEVASPQADADAIGAYFAKSAQTSVVRPDSTFFVVEMNRATDGKAVNVTAATTDATKNGVFNGAPTSFAFAEGKQLTEVEVSYKPTVFQRHDVLAYEINGGKKDHIYGDGYAATSIDFCVDYTWQDSIQTSIKEDETTGLAHKLGNNQAEYPTKLQFAMDYKKVKNPSRKSVVRIEDFFGKLQLGEGGNAHLQFALDANNANPELLSDNFFDNNNAANITMPKVFEAGMTQTVYVNEGGKVEAAEYPVYVEFQNISENNGTFTVTYLAYAAKDEKATTYYAVKTLTDADKKAEAKNGTASVSKNTQDYTATFSVTFSTEE